MLYIYSAPKIEIHYVFFKQVVNCSVVHDRLNVERCVWGTVIVYKSCIWTFSYFFCFVCYFVWYKLNGKKKIINSTKPFKWWSFLRTIGIVCILIDRDRLSYKFTQLHNVDLWVFRYFLLHFIDVIFKIIINIST